MVFDFYPTGSGEMLLALSLADFSDDEGRRIFPSVSTMAKKTRQSERSVQYQLRRMEQAGFISQVSTKSNYGTTEYRINIGFLMGGAKIVPPAKKGKRGAVFAHTGASAIAPYPPTNSPNKQPPIVFPNIAPIEKEAIGCLLADMPYEVAQAIADEIEGSRRVGKITIGVIPLCRALVTAAKKGTFVESRGVSIRIARETVVSIRTTEELDPIAMATGRKIIEDIRTRKGVHD